jgi:hypothetical protein
MPDKGTIPFADEPILGALCNYLGRIPVANQPVPKNQLPSGWDTFSGNDWEQLVTKAQTHGLAPLLYWILSRSGKFSILPELTRNSLRAAYYGTWVYNQLILKELETLAKAFKPAGIQVVVLKGACYALTIYPDIGLRPMSDLDLLVLGVKRSEAVQIAKSHGYKKTLPEASRGLDDLLGHHASLQKTGSPSISLEIHDSLVADHSFRYAVPVEWFWGQIEPLSTSLEASHQDLFMLTPTAQVLYAASHAMLQHGGKNAPLRWFYDLNRLICFYSDRLDWELLLSQARIFEWGSALDAAFSKTVSCFNTPVPKEVLTKLLGQNDRHRKLVALKQVRPVMHSLDEGQKLLSLKGYSRLRLFLALLAPSPAYLRWRYHIKNSWTTPFYYVIRWWGIFKDGFRSLVSLIKKESPDYL